MMVVFGWTGGLFASGVCCTWSVVKQLVAAAHRNAGHNPLSHATGTHHYFYSHWSKATSTPTLTTPSCRLYIVLPAVTCVQGEKRRKQLVGVVQQVALRRTKAIIADQLPRKTDNVVFCQLQPLQYRWGEQDVRIQHVT